MSLNELDQGIDKDILLQEINQIKSTLEATYDLTDLDETDGLPANENEEKEVEEVESDDEEPRKKTKNLNFGCKRNCVSFLLPFVFQSILDLCDLKLQTTTSHNNPPSTCIVETVIVVC